MKIKVELGPTLPKVSISDDPTSVINLWYHALRYSAQNILVTIEIQMQSKHCQRHNGPEG